MAACDLDLADVSVSTTTWGHTHLGGDGAVDLTLAGEETAPASQPRLAAFRVEIDPEDCDVARAILA